LQRKRKWDTAKSFVEVLMGNTTSEGNQLFESEEGEQLGSWMEKVEVERWSNYENDARSLYVLF
jgi:hypothetical protein